MRSTIFTASTRLAFLLGTLLGAMTPAQLRAGQIDFDDAPNGTIIDARYAGVTFGCVGCGSGHAFARDMQSFGSSTAASGLNVVTLVPPFSAGDPNSSILTSFNASQGAVSATFAVPQRMVSIDARPQLPLEFLGAAANKPYLELYSSATQSSATLIARVLYPLNFGDPGYCSPSTSACGGPFRTLSYTSGSDNIVSIRISSQQSQGGPSVYADFDNLVFQTGVELFAASAEATFCADFNSGVPSGVSLFGNARVDAGYLKLVTVPGDSFGIAYITDFNKGQQVHGFRATFDAALFGSTCCGGGIFPADGFSFNVVPAATVLSNPGYGEPGEEGLDQGLAINFDTWDNEAGEAPAIEVKWLGQVVARAPFQPSQSPSGIVDPVAASRAVVIQLDTDGTVDVSYGGVAIFGNLPTPYRSSAIGTPKWVFGARVGLATDNHWIDNLCITQYAGPKSCQDFNSGSPAGLSLFGGARTEAGILKLLTLPEDSYGVAYVSDFGGGQLVQAFRATFKAALFGSTCCGGGAFPADGFSFNLAPAATVRPSPVYNEPAEEGLDEGLAVNFDTWDNLDGGGEGPAIEVKWLGQVVARTLFQPSQSPAGATTAAAAWRDVVIDLRTDGVLNVSYGGSNVLSNVQVPYVPEAIHAPVWVMGARVGGANDNHWFEDLCITTVPVRRRPIPGLFSTGVGENGLALADNQVDPHYVVIPTGPSIDPTFPVYAATSAGGFPIPPWLPDARVSAWISGATDAVRLPGLHIYETKFDLTGLTTSTARIAGRWAADNTGTQILLNGVAVTAPQAPSFDGWTPFQINSGFVAGTNTLRFLVDNQLDISQPQGRNPSGLRVELWGSAGVNCAFAPPNPNLAIQRRGGEVELNWRGVGFVLQGASIVAGPYTDLTRGISANGRDFKTIVTPSSGARFYRLRQDCN